MIADIGSGTGILSRLFLEHGNRVLGIEPNREMREAAERALAGYPSFTSVDATAEATTLPDSSVDFVTAGQAFHWFDPDAAKAEFSRILRPPGCVVLVWNERRTESPFMREYEQLLRELGTDYAEVTHRNVGGARLAGFFAPNAYRLLRFDNRQVFDYESLVGRLLSSSFAPQPGDPRHERMLKRLREIFDRHETGGKVSFDYDTKLYFGRLAP